MSPAAKIISFIILFSAASPIYLQQDGFTIPCFFKNARVTFFVKVRLGMVSNM